MNTDANITTDRCSSYSRSGSTSTTVSRPNTFATSLTSPSLGIQSRNVTAAFR